MSSRTETYAKELMESVTPVGVYNLDGVEIISIKIWQLHRKLELTLKITEFPTDVQTVENNWKQFTVDCDGRIFTITVKPKMFKKLEEAQANYPMWVAAIAGKLGEATPDGFVLADPAIQVFEKKPLILQGNCT